MEWKGVEVEAETEMNRICLLPDLNKNPTLGKSNIHMYTYTIYVYYFQKSRTNV